jgi:hypothetical protein
LEDWIFEKNGIYVIVEADWAARGERAQFFVNACFKLIVEIQVVDQVFGVRLVVFSD